MKNKVLLRFLIASLVLVVYIFFAAEPTGKQTFIQPLHISPILPDESQANIPQNTDDVFPFVSGLAFGYYNKAGDIVFAKAQKDNFSISDSFWAQYQAIPIRSETPPPPIQCFSPQGTALFSLPVSGLVHFRKDRIFEFLPSGNSVAEYSVQGELLWVYSVSGVITAFDCNEDLVVIGTSDGNITCLNSDGTEKISFYPGGSEYEVIYGVSLSKDGKYLACLCGLQRQRLLLVEIADYHKPVFHTFLDASLQRQATLFFDTTSRYLFLETGDGLVILRCVDSLFVATGIQGKLMSTNLDSSTGILTVLTQEGGKATISFFDLNCKKVGSEQFDCISSSLSQVEDYYYLVLDEKLLRFTVTKQ